MTLLKGMGTKIKTIIRDIVVGGTIYETLLKLAKQRYYDECALRLVTIGDMLGCPISSYYRLKLLPFWLRDIPAWKREMTREKDILEKI